MLLLLLLADNNNPDHHLENPDNPDHFILGAWARFGQKRVPLGFSIQAGTVTRRSTRSLKL